MVGTERHESRRIDNQLRGRTGRCAHQRPVVSTRIVSSIHRGVWSLTVPMGHMLTCRL